MKLEDYLKRIKECPEEAIEINFSQKDRRIVHRLTADFGIYDNWPFFLNSDFNKVVKDLQESQLYKLKREIKLKPPRKEFLFDYIPESLELQAYNWIPSFFCRGSEKERKMQARGYNITMVLLHKHIYEKSLEISCPKLATAIVNLGEYVLKNDIPACFPKSIGWNNLNGNSKIIYHEPRLKIYTTYFTPS